MTKGDAISILMCCTDLLNFTRSRNGILQSDDMENMSILLDNVRVFVAENVEDDTEKEFPSLRDMGFVDY